MSYPALQDPLHYVEMISGYVTNLNNREQNSASTPVVPGVAYYYVIDKGRVWGASMNYRF